MVQIWMTHEELAQMLNCTVMEARDRIHFERLDRKISRDGHKRAKLNAMLTGIFIERIRASASAIEQAVEDLKSIHGLMNQKEDGTPPGLRRVTSK
jgi:hypothetical protein